jgi:hypothetical protein
MSIINPNINQSIPPVFKKFTVSGRVQDKGKSLEKVKVSVGLGESALGLRSTRTDNQGKFKFDIKLQIDEETGQSYYIDYNLRYQKKGYAMETQPIVAGDGSILTTLNNITLISKESKLKEEKSILSNSIEEETQQIKKLVNTIGIIVSLTFLYWDNTTFFKA